MMERHNKCDRKALKDHGAAIMCDEESITGHEEAIQGDEETLKVNGSDKV